MRVISFDLDNTLISSDEVHLRAYNSALKASGFSPVDPLRLKHLFGLPKKKIIAACVPTSSASDRRAIFDSYTRALVRNKMPGVVPISGVISALKKLSKTYTLALASNTSHKGIQRLLLAAKIDPALFSLIVGCDDVQHSKPEPDELLYIRRELGPISYHVGDSTSDLRAARAARVKGIGVLTGHYTREILKKEKPYKILASVKELPGAIL